MSRLIPAAERLTRARAFIQQARDLPIPEDGGKYNFSYVAQVKDLMQKARDMVKFISYTPSATPEMKMDVQRINQETIDTERDILH